MDHNDNRRSAAFESAAYTLSIISLVGCTCIYVSVICGALAIIFALLSAGGASSMSRRAVWAIWFAAAGIVLTLCVTAYSFYTTLQTYGSLEGLLRAYAEQIGISYEDLIESLY